MQREVLDTSILISYWRKQRGASLAATTVAEVRRWARAVAAIYQSEAIVSPVYLEMVAGVTSKHELELTRAFLGEFKVLDKRNITPDDWTEALRLAQRVPRDRSPRQLGDCLIRAIANRLGYGVATLDLGFPK